MLNYGCNHRIFLFHIYKKIQMDLSQYIRKTASYDRSSLMNRYLFVCKKFWRSTRFFLLFIYIPQTKRNRYFKAENCAASGNENLMLATTCTPKSHFHLSFQNERIYFNGSVLLNYFAKSTITD